MFIKNLKKDETRFYYCNNLVGKYLEKKGIPLLSQKDGQMIFAKTEKLQKVLDSMPFYIKVLGKAGDKYER